MFMGGVPPQRDYQTMALPHNPMFPQDDMSF